MSAKQPACPSFGNGITVSVTNASTAFTLLAKSQQVICTNLSANVIYIRITPAGGNATTADQPIQPNGQIIITKFYDQLAGAAIASVAGPSSLHLMPAEGYTIS